MAILLFFEKISRSGIERIYTNCMGECIMSLSDSIALWQAIVATIGLLVLIVGGVIAISQYLKVIKSTDENAKERQQALDSIAEKYQLLAKDLTNQMNTIARRNLIAMGIMAVALVIMIFSERQDREGMRRDINDLKRR